MGFGQYSRGSTRRTKADMVDTLAPLGSVEWAKRAGHNRLHFKLTDGREGFMLHATVIAMLSADRSTLTMDNGGWATPTTHSAMGDALRAFGKPTGYAHGNRGQTSFGGVSFDRSAKFAWPSLEPLNTSPPLPTIRATSDSAESYGDLVVTYDGETVKSSGDVSLTVPPFRVILALRAMSEVCKRNRRWFGTMNYSRYPEGNHDDPVKLLGDYEATSGRWGRTVFVGCHEFRTQDIRAALRRIEADYPEGKALADKFTRAARKRVKSQAAAMAANDIHAS